MISSSFHHIAVTSSPGMNGDASSSPVEYSPGNRNQMRSPSVSSRSIVIRPDSSHCSARGSSRMSSTSTETPYHANPPIATRNSSDAGHGERGSLASMTWPESGGASIVNEQTEQRLAAEAAAESRGYI